MGFIVFLPLFILEIIALLPVLGLQLGPAMIAAAIARIVESITSLF